MAITLTIAGSSKAYRIGSLQISSPVNGRQTASFEVRSNDGTYRPALDASVVIADGATTLFGGLIDSPQEEGTLGDETGAYDGISTRINAVSYHAYTERRFVNLTLSAGTLKSMLTTLVSTYLSGYGVTLDGGQVDGPSLPELTYDYTRLSDVLDELMTLTGKYGNPYVWTVDSSKVLSAYQPSSEAAPFNITDGDGNTIGDVTVDRTRHDYANTIILRVPPKTEVNHVETFTGDGSTYSFPLTYTLTAMRYTVQVDGVDELLTFQGIGFDAAVHWLYYASDNTIRRIISGITNDPPANGAAISITFDGTYQGLATATDSGEVASYGIWERVIVVDSVPADTTAQALADAYLARAIASPKAIKYRTFRSGLAVGQSQTITNAQRNLSALACVVTEVVTRDYGTGSNGARKLLYDVTLTSGVNPQDQWRDIYRLWAGDKTGGNAKFTVGAGTGGGTVGPAPPDHAVQFDDAGGFGGDDAFLYYKNENSLVCGSGSALLSASAESCQVFGYNNSIADA